MFESLKARLERFLRASSDPRSREAALREALLEAKVGVSTMRSALAATEAELAQERRRLTDAERRGRLAEELPDAETAGLAHQYAGRYRERIALLERKLSVQRDELVMAEQEVSEILREYRGVRPEHAAESIEAAWRDLQAAGGERPGTGLEDSPRSDLADEKLKRAVEEQLAYLKRKLGRDQ